ncbi:hypothetical protein IWZ03DRAFT_370365 [Phyllosticta citriasiana]|uniref:Secreted protein n=1 Tax=Phyllosticta citriasiana TaxID=595635 RepID=A0ABR1KVD2_9PEZI
MGWWREAPISFPFFFLLHIFHSHRLFCESGWAADMRRYRPTCAAAAAAWPLPTHQPLPWWQASWPCRRGQFRLLHWEQRWSLQAAKRLAGSVLQSVSQSVPSTYLPTYA